MANIKCEPWQFEKVCESALRNYYESVCGDCADVINKVADSTVEKLKNDSPKRENGGQYAESWDKRKAVHDKKTGLLSATVYVKSPHYRLTHLLEFGHIIVYGENQGKRRKPVGQETKRPHIKKAEQAAIIMLADEMEKRLKK